MKDGRLRITRRGGDDIQILVDTITNVTPTYSKKVLTTPIVGMGMDATFPVETGSGVNITFSFKRDNPTDTQDDDSDDSSKWSNKTWYERLTDFMNEWQFRSDGVRVQYNLPEGSDEVNPYIPSIDEFGYIRRVQRSYNSNFNTVISGTIEVSVGTAFLNKDYTKKEYHSSARVTIDPGTLGENYIKAYDSGGTLITSTTTIGGVFGSLSTAKRTRDLPLDTFVEVVPTDKDYATVSFKAPYPPPAWVAMAGLANMTFSNWSFAGASYSAGAMMSATLSSLESSRFVAQWRKSDE